jgi:hypothetical protein
MERSFTVASVWPLAHGAHLPSPVLELLARRIDDVTAAEAEEAGRRLGAYLARQARHDPAIGGIRIGQLFPVLERLDDLNGLSVRSYNSAMRVGENSWRRISRLSISDLADWPNVGVKTVEEILTVGAMISLVRAHQLELGPIEHEEITGLALPPDAVSASVASTSSESSYPVPDLDDLPLAEALSLAADEALSPRDRDIWNLRYGQSREYPTLAQIGEQYQVTRERVRQILERSTHRIRAKSDATLLRGLSPSVDGPYHRSSAG